MMPIASKPFSLREHVESPNGSPFPDRARSCAKNPSHHSEPRYLGSPFRLRFPTLAPHRPHLRHAGSFRGRLRLHPRQNARGSSLLLQRNRRGARRRTPFGDLRCSHDASRTRHHPLRSFALHIIVAADGAHLIDFGISQMRGAKYTGNTTPLGTWGFAAPEQYGFAEVSERSDLTKRDQEDRSCTSAALQYAPKETEQGTARQRKVTKDNRKDGSAKSIPLPAMIAAIVVAVVIVFFSVNYLVFHNALSPDSTTQNTTSDNSNDGLASDTPLHRPSTLIRRALQATQNPVFPSSSRATATTMAISTTA